AQRVRQLELVVHPVDREGGRLAEVVPEVVALLDAASLGERDTARLIERGGAQPPRRDEPSARVELDRGRLRAARRQRGVEDDDVEVPGVASLRRIDRVDELVDVSG